MKQPVSCTFHLCKLYATYAQRQRVLTSKEINQAILDFFNDHNPADRIQGEGVENSDDRQFLYDVLESNGIVRGIALNWEKDAHVQTIRVPLEGKNVYLDSIGAKKLLGDKVAEVIRSITAFAIKGPYIAHCERNARQTLLQETLDYILCKQFKQTITTELSPLPPKYLTDEILSKISKMEVCQSIDTENVSSKLYKFTKNTLRFIPAMMGDSREKFTEDISGDLELNISLKVKNKHHLSKDSRRILSCLAKIFINLPNAKIKLDENTYLTKEIMQISKAMQIESDKKILNYDMLLEKLSLWLEQNLPSNADV